MKVIVTSIGSISAPFVIQTLKGMNVTVIGTDMYPKEWVASSLDVHHFYQVPPTKKSKVFYKRIAELCEIYNPDMIIPLTDVDVDFFSQNLHFFVNVGVTVTISNKTTIQSFRNKLNLYNTYKKSVFKAIPTYSTIAEYIEKCNKFPCIAKKINGRSSEGLYIYKKPFELKDNIKLDKSYIFQPFIKGDIIVIDAVKNNEGKFVYIARKELVRTPNGAGLTVELLNNFTLNSMVEKFCQSTKFKGCINIELIKHGVSYYLMDINPRPSAGIAFSGLAGYNFVKNHVAVFLGQPIDDAPIAQYNGIITRKYVEILV